MCWFTSSHAYFNQRCPGLLYGISYLRDQFTSCKINADKTKLMKFNARFDNYQPVPLKIGNHLLEEVESYCYLGIEIHKSGSFTNARTELKKKAMRALYAMKSSVNKSKLSFRSLTTLFDGLIKPIVL